MPLLPHLLFVFNGELINLHVNQIMKICINFILKNWKFGIMREV